jgi:hypothetical protein
LLALTIIVVVALLGAFGGGLAGFRLVPGLGEHSRGRIARRAVALLGALAGAEIATQLVELVRQLEADAGASGVLRGVAGGLQAVDFAIAFRQVLFSGGLLIGLAALVGVAATRRYGEAAS